MNDNNFNDQNNTGPEDKHFPIINPALAAVIGAVGIFFLYQVAGSILTLLIVGFDINNADVTSIRLLTIAGQLLFILVPAMILARVIYFDVGAIMRIKKPAIIEYVIFGAGLLLLVFLLQNFIAIQTAFIEWLAGKFEIVSAATNLLDRLDEFINETYDRILGATSFWEMSFVVFVVSVTPAFCEEFLFRGYIQKSLEYKLRPFYAALITGVIFGMYHFNPYGLIPLIALGTFFGYAAYTTGSIFIPVTLHFINNFISIVVYYIAGNEVLSNSAEVSEGELGISAAWFFVSLIVFIAYIIYVNKYYNKLRGGSDDMS